ncbi:DUF4199 domain-containing protein [Hymenobacter sp. J193]|uniref:DUF4199 domain-containing protein n=1 Tax=Hymenobacter sp. J193 TaxID=2898429 RepID=UPI002151BCB5|nr:DUF4199 domain-containing protein [Hymenobacter sp. J193]MCR5889106.1 DUF4199 domain-containing protein [Hymenobacter sp. J193]
MVRTAALCGVLTGALCFLWVLFLYKTGNNPYGPKRTLSDFFPPIAAILSQVWLRRQYAQGPGLARAVGVGLLTTLLAAAVAATALYLFAQAAGPGLIEQHLAEAHKMLAAAKPLYAKEANGLKQYEATLRNLAHTPEGFGQDEFLKKLLLGTIVGIPGGIFLRK